MESRTSEYYWILVPINSNALCLALCSITNFVMFVQALDTIKKSASSMPKDDAKRIEKEVSILNSAKNEYVVCQWIFNLLSFRQIEELTKKFIKSADDMCKAKEKEISGNWSHLWRWSYVLFTVVVFCLHSNKFEQSGSYKFLKCYCPI